LTTAAPTAQESPQPYVTGTKRQFWAYQAGSAPGVNTVLQGPDTPSRIMLPMVPLTGVELGPPLPCGVQEAVRCVAQPG
jgi:hypothetical protein